MGSEMGWLIAAVATTVFFASLFWLLKKRQDRVAKNVEDRFIGRERLKTDSSALLRALESKGYSQSQGSGFLVLTGDELYFESAFPSIQLSVPTDKIRWVGETKRMGGQSPGRAMLKVVFDGSDGEQDACAISVADLPGWQQSIGDVIQAVDS